jgi:AraC-like DNA-binding protein
VDLTASTQDLATVEADFDRVHARLFRGFPALVSELGGDPDALLRRVGADPDLAASEPPSHSYRGWVQLLELAAAELQRPDFGMRLAKRQGGVGIFGPMGAVMKNSTTLGDAVGYATRHSHAHSLAARLRPERDQANGRLFIGYEILLERLPNKRQAVEQLLLLAHLNTVEITGGRARVRQVRFRHQPLSSPRTYRRYFGCEALFDQQEDGVVFSDWDLKCPIVERDAQLYETAASFVEARFGPLAPPMHARVRAVVLQRIGAQDCSNERVAAELGLHIRTLHRRLKTEGKSFEEIKDEVRRDLALGYLTETDLPLTTIAEKLGYAEHSVLTRSCARWFAASPRQLRARAGAARRLPTSDAGR